MATHAELLKSMVQDIINDRHEQAEVTIHDYVVSKTREVTGLGGPTEPDDVSSQVSDEDDE